MLSSSEPTIPKMQRAWTVPKQGRDVVLDEHYPVPQPGAGQVLVKVLYTGVCQSDLHTARGTATGPDGQPITAIKLPHVGGHEGVGRIVAFGPDSAAPPSQQQQQQQQQSADNNNIAIGTLVGIRFLASVCHACEFCTSGREQHCQRATNHLHHRDGSFQEYTVLERAYLTVLPSDIDPKVVGPVLCAGLTAFKAVKNASLKQGDWLCVVGAGGGLGHLAVQYGLAAGANVVGVDAGDAKQQFIESLGAQFVDFTKTRDVRAAVTALTGGEDGGGGGGCHAVVVTSGHPAAFTQAADLLRIGGTLCCVGIPPGDVTLSTPVAAIVIRGLRIVGNLVGSLAETLEAVEYVRTGKVQVHVEVRPFAALPDAYRLLEAGDVPGRIVLEVARDE